MSAPAAPLGTLEVALTHAQRLLARDPAAAAEQAAEILKVHPDLPEALALSGLALGYLGKGEEAIAALRRAVHFKAELPDAWRALGDHLTAIGDIEGAQSAYAEQIRHSTHDPRLMEAAAHLCENRIAPAEALLLAHLKQFPTDVPAMRMLAEVAARLGRYGDAEVLLERALELAPTFVPARHNYAFVLHRAGKSAEALAQLDRLLATDTDNSGYLNLKAAVLSRTGDVEESLRIYEKVTARYPNHAKVWLSYGHALKTAGRQDDCVRAYRRTLELAPHLGEAWWSLANLKTVGFDVQDREAMQAQLHRADLSIEDRFHFHFALGKAFEDAQRFADSFDHYSKGNALRRETIEYDAAENTSHVQRSKAFFTAELFASKTGSGCQAPDPIFIVGLPRAGSTLLEQILASHPQVEGTQELPDLAALARELGGKKTRHTASLYPEILGGLSDDELRALGERYLQQTRIQRKTDSPFFIDKLPNNWAHVGLIQLILPRAKIVDARRHPLGCCFSGFKQHFAHGQSFSYGLDNIGRYYRDYVDLMRHFDAVLPGRIHRVIYEQLVADTEHEVRRLLDYCGLPFEDACLRFFENERPVRTASSEQVRQPIYKSGVDHWQHYEPWLDPLKTALGPALTDYAG